MNHCQSTRDRLNALTAPERAVEGEVMAHLESCPDCQRYVQQLDAFDEKVSTILKDVEIPPALHEQLLEAVQNEQLSETAQTELETVPQIIKLPNRVKSSNSASRISTVARALIGTAAAALIVFVSMIWTQPTQVESLNYATAKSTLREAFFQIDESQWNQLPNFDQKSFQISNLDRAIQKFQLSSAVGIDLGMSPDHDAAAFQFSYQDASHRQWSGTVIVLPNSEFTGTPTETVPGSASGLQVLEWKSTDGTLTYLCFVERGSADELANAMFGAIG